LGCDIHMFIEKRVDNQFPWEADEHHVIEVEDVVDDVEYTTTKEISADGRDYNLFGILAGVRGDGCLYDIRGLPNNVSDVIMQASDSIGVDGHSHSYLSVDEFKKCLVKAGYDLEASDRTDAFYEWGSWTKPDGKYDFDKHPPSFTTIVNYCEAWIKEIAKEDFLGIDEYRPEIRLIFWFDN
jgi:hypothetical protein